MALLDIDSIGPRLRKIKIRQIDPRFLDDILELAGEHGHEITITSSGSLDFLYTIYKAEKARDKKRNGRLKKAERLILTLAGLYLHHESRQPSKGKREESRPKARYGMQEEEIRIGRRLRELFESIGIIEVKEMRMAVSLLGETGVESRIERARRSALGEQVLKGVFGENPETIRIPKEDDFVEELLSMEMKKGVIDRWREDTKREPPIWADYNQSPSVLLAEYDIIFKGLGMEGKPGMDTAGFVGRTAPLGPEQENSRRERAPFLSEEEMPHGTGRPDAAESKRARMLSGVGPGGKLAALEALGIDVTRLSVELESISSEPDTGTRSREQERFDSSISLIFDLITAKDLEGTINWSIGTSGLKISSIKYLSGASGAFELQLTGKGGEHAGRVYLSLQDMEPARIGKELVEAGGLVAHRIWTRDSSGRQLSSERQRYALAEDARNVGKRGKVKLRMPESFRVETVNATGAAMFKEDIVLRPDPGNGLHAEYYRTLADEEGRRGILRALLAYFEMSRRSLLPDRRPPNTYVLRVRKGERASFTFQPTDMDGIGNFIDGKDGEPDFSDFHRDFYKAAVDFAVQTHEGMLRAAGIGMIADDEVPDVRSIFHELAKEARKPFPPDNAGIRARRKGIFRDHDGEMIGIGFDASQYTDHSIPSQGGRCRIIRNDGRVMLDAERAERTADIAGSGEACREFLDGLGPAGAGLMGMLPKRVAEIADAMIEALEMPQRSESEKKARDERLKRLRSRTGGELAFRVLQERELAGVKGERRLRIAERKARGLIFGSELPDPAGDDVETERKTENTELTRPDKASSR